MAASDSTIPYSMTDGSLTLYDGSGASLTVPFVQADPKWTVEGAPFTEARTRNLHHSTPTTRKTGDGNTTGSIMALVPSLLGSAAKTLYEWLTFSGGGTSLTTVGAGDKKQLRMVLTGNASAAGGATQTVTFGYCVFANVAVDPAGQDGLWTVSADFTDMENEPVIA